jgi:hypothetical protein
MLLAEFLMACTSRVGLDGGEEGLLVSAAVR